MELGAGRDNERDGGRQVAPIPCGTARPVGHFAFVELVFNLTA
jgi:hypothetical protein